ncbi:MAG: hypothetical protein RL521_1210 [Bacteroidota bacterium]|jgi:hypothetical protein
MNRLFKIGLFFVLPIGTLLFFLLSMSSYHLPFYHPQLPNQKKVLVIGNSHPECAIIEKSDDDFVNLGKSGECFYYSVKKAEWFVANNPQLKQVWIELAPNQFMPHMENWIGDVEYEQRAMLSFPFLMDFNWEWNAWSKAPVTSLQTKLVQARRYWSAVLWPRWSADRDAMKWGGYREMKGRSKTFENEEEKRTSTLQPNAENWNSLYQFCKKMQSIGVQVHAFQCPEFEQYEIFDRVVAYCKKNDLAVTSYHPIAFTCGDSSLFYDAGHLNEKGAKAFTIAFENELSHQLQQ